MRRFETDVKFKRKMRRFVFGGKQRIEMTMSEILYLKSAPSVLQKEKETF